MSETANRFNMPVPSGFEDAHRCWLEVGGESFARQFISGPDTSFYQGEYWKIVREIILKRDSFRCAKCNDAANQVHHLNYHYVGQDHFFPKSLISVCGRCHRLFEHIRRVEVFSSKIRSLIIRPLANPVHTYAKLLEYQDAVAAFRASYYSGVPHITSQYIDEEDRTERLEEFRRRQNSYRESAQEAIATLGNENNPKEKYVRESLENELAACENFLKETLGRLYGWENEYLEKRAGTDDIRKITIEKASLLAKEAASKLDFDAQTIVGQCPKCGSNVLLQSNGYFCENLKAASNPCKFNVKIEILRRHIEPDQVSKLLKNGRTDLLENFISNSGKAFSAYLALASGRLVFEFPIQEDGTFKRPE